MSFRTGPPARREFAEELGRRPRSHSASLGRDPSTRRKARDSLLRRSRIRHGIAVQQYLRDRVAPRSGGLAPPLRPPIAPRWVVFKTNYGRGSPDADVEGGKALAEVDLYFQGRWSGV